MTQATVRWLLAVCASPAGLLLGKATLVPALALILYRLSRRRSAAVRHAVLGAAFAVLLLLPVVGFLAPALRISVPLLSPAAAAPTEIGPAGAADPAVSTSLLVLGATPAQDPAAGAGRLPRLGMTDVILAIWGIGSAIFVLPVVAGLSELRRIRRAGIPWREGQALADGIGKRAGRRRSASVLVHEGVAGVVTFGLLHPAVLLPIEARYWQVEDLERALTHELEHVLRCDWLTHCLARTATALYWYHPLVWMAWGRLTLQAECACDDAVLRHSEALPYANQLVTLAETSLPSRSAMPALANRADLSSRIHAVLDSSQRRARMGWRVVAIAGATAALLVATLAPLRLTASSQAAAPTSLPAVAYQQAAGAEFAVASVQPCKPSIGRGGRGGGGSGAEYSSPGRLVLPCSTVRSLIRIAYVRTYFRTSGDALEMEGGPAWIDTAQYAINAEADGPATIAEMEGPMLQRLLQDHFHLQTHTEKRSTAVYVLTVGTGGLRVKASVPGSCQARLSGDADTSAPAAGQKPYCGEVGIALSPGARAFRLASGTLQQLALNLGPQLGRTVVDETNVSGKFDFDFPFAPDSTDPGYAGNAPSIYTALGAMGLRLEPGKRLRGHLVIDHAEQPDGTGSDVAGDAAAAQSTPALKFDNVSIQPRADTSADRSGRAGFRP